MGTTWVYITFNPLASVISACNKWTLGGPCDRTVDGTFRANSLFLTNAKTTFSLEAAWKEWWACLHHSRLGLCVLIDERALVRYRVKLLRSHMTASLLNKGKALRSGNRLVCSSYSSLFIPEPSYSLFLWWSLKTFRYPACRRTRRPGVAMPDVTVALQNVPMGNAMHPSSFGMVELPILCFKLWPLFTIALGKSGH